MTEEMGKSWQNGAGDQMIRELRRCSALVCLVLLGGCAAFQPAPSFDEAVVLNASSAALDVDQAVVLTDNDDAFESKLELIRSADESIDLAYFIYADDYSSSLMAKELVAAAQRGVRVRLLVDYLTNYSRLDWFSMMEARGSAGAGTLEVRFYGRPTRNIVKDAVFLTMGCGEAGRSSSEDCGPAKFAEIEQRFAGETIEGVSAEDLNVSNLNVGGSGLFLSGLYGKNPKLIQLAVAEGQGLDPKTLQDGSSDPEDLEQLKTLGQIYFQSRYGSGLNRVTAQIKLAAIGLFYEEQIDPIYDVFTAYLPAERGESSAATRRDWRYLSDYLHHKLLLVDGRAFQLGGRNVEDSYHMSPNDLTAKYVFRDTDVRVVLKNPDPELSASFDRIWSFSPMVASMAEVRSHAPNELYVAMQAASEACAGEQGKGDSDHSACQEEALLSASERSFDQRIQAKHEQMLRNARTYAERYQPQGDTSRTPSFPIDQAARVNYVENLPFDRSLDVGQLQRNYGARVGSEGADGKHIHAVWLAALREVCKVASAEKPQQVILHNAYFFPPSNLTAGLAEMVDGTNDCANVTVTVLTNSIDTTDLNVVNIAARHSLKAFAEFYAESRDSQRGARFRYFEYQPQDEPGSSNLSLHSKVAVLGPNLFIGSANADVRSFMMDSNNGILVRNAPLAIAQYSEWVDFMLADESLTREQTEYFRLTPRSQMLDEDRANVRAILAKYRAERWIDDQAQLQSIDENLERILEQAYTDTKQGLSGGRSGGEAQQRFNASFETI